MMAFGFGPFRQREYAILAADVSAAHALARLHREDFIRPWTDGEFAEMLKQAPVFGFAACEEGKGEGAPVGFVLVRLVAGEAEILTIAVARNVRRHGIGRKLMDAAMRRLHTERAQSLFLEVDESNAPAIALYRKLGFRKVGERKAYYEAKDGKRSSAIVMRVDFR